MSIEKNLDIIATSLTRIADALEKYAQPRQATAAELSASEINAAVSKTAAIESVYEPKPDTIDLKKLSTEQLIGLAVVYGKHEKYSEEALAAVDELIHGNEANDDSETISKIVLGFKAFPQTLKMYPETQIAIATRVEQQFTTLPDQDAVNRFVMQVASAKPEDRATAVYEAPKKTKTAKTETRDYASEAKKLFVDLCKTHREDMVKLLDRYKAPRLTAIAEEQLPAVVAELEAIKNA